MTGCQPKTSARGSSSRGMKTLVRNGVQISRWIKMNSFLVSLTIELNWSGRIPNGKLPCLRLRSSWNRGDHTAPKKLLKINGTLFGTWSEDWYPSGTIPNQIDRNRRGIDPPDLRPNVRNASSQDDADQSYHHHHHHDKNNLIFKLNELPRNTFSMLNA